ncbi:MAG TPA: DUF305 domain-containing protein [Mycobacteriales bacterium]|nr:DUF305 domain-containing protein [Mycobacteriales bacterium]
MPTPATFALTAVLAAGLIAVSGCSSEQSSAARPEPTRTFTADVPVLVPGGPGESPEVVAPGQSRAVPNADFYGDADVAFVRDMIVHHAQALQMAALADDRAGDDRVRRLAGRIAAAQGPEIAAMQAWLESRGLAVPDTDAGHGAGHGAGDMPGMATPEELTRLAAAKGTDFDRLFLELMTRHHQGALQMVDDPGGSAQHPLVVDMVADTGVKQSAEIRRMQELLADL